MHNKTPAKKSSRADIQGFLAKVDQLPVRSNKAGRVLFAIDATASRQPTWDMALGIQGEMFSATKSLGGISAQLCYYRGFNEFHCGPWVNKSADLLKQMQTVFCLGGHTQIGRVLEHAINECQIQKLSSVIFIGDACEENADTLANLAGQLGIRGVPMFVFHEGQDPSARNVFQHLTKLTKGAYLPFNTNSAKALSALLGAVAIYSTGGLKALQQHGDQTAAQLLTHQLESR
jgi:hypothetical protein